MLVKSLPIAVLNFHPLETTTATRMDFSICGIQSQQTTLLRFSGTSGEMSVVLLELLHLQQTQEPASAHFVREGGVIPLMKPRQQKLEHFQAEHGLRGKRNKRNATRYQLTASRRGLGSSDLGRNLASAKLPTFLTGIHLSALFSKYKKNATSQWHFTTSVFARLVKECMLASIEQASEGMGAVSGVCGAEEGGRGSCYPTSFMGQI